MWTAAGHDGPSTVAAMRAAVSGAERANLWDHTIGDNLNAFRVHAHQWWEGATFLPDLAHPVIEECRAQVPEALGVDPNDIPDPPCRRAEGPSGPAAGSSSASCSRASPRRTGARFPPAAASSPGAVALPHLLTRAAELATRAPLTIIVGVESFLRQRIVEHYIERARLLCGTNSSGLSWARPRPAFSSRHWGRAPRAGASHPRHRRRARAEPRRRLQGDARSPPRA